MRMKRLCSGGRKLTVLILALHIPGMFNFSCRSLHSPEKSPLMEVIRVVDGDTFWASDGTSHGLKVRLIGVDAPEIHATRRKAAGYFGPESRDYLRKLIAGKKVRLEYDVTRYDQYHRTLAYVFLEDGTFVNAELIKEGYAVVLTVPPNVKYADVFTRLQRKARRQKRGLWAVNL
jgi:micrococcal nuclease